MEILWGRQKLKDQVIIFAKSNPITARRMIAIKAASCFLDLECASNGRAHFLKGVHKNNFAIDLEKKGNGKRLICVPMGEFEFNNGQFVKSTITAFKVIEIKDYH